jgi:hypothetical protein
LFQQPRMGELYPHACCDAAKIRSRF